MTIARRVARSALPVGTATKVDEARPNKYGIARTTSPNKKKIPP
jgi:hypothetical protein